MQEISNRVRNRGRKLKCEPFAATSWLVTGGESPHLVTKVVDQLFCDCRGAKTPGDICSHKFCVMIKLDPEKYRPIGNKAPSYYTIKTFLKRSGYEPGQLARYGAAVVATTGRKPNYPAEIKETIAEMVYRFLKGK